MLNGLTVHVGGVSEKPETCVKLLCNPTVFSSDPAGFSLLKLSSGAGGGWIGADNERAERRVEGGTRAHQNSMRFCARCVLAPATSMAGKHIT